MPPLLVEDLGIVQDVHVHGELVVQWIVLIQYPLLERLLLANAHKKRYIFEQATGEQIQTHQLVCA